jgi:hypothetical protein
MPDRLRCLALPAAALAVGLFTLTGCSTETPTLPGNVGTTSTVELPESTPPVLTKAVADRIRPGMTQEEVLVILRDASRETPSAKTSIEAAHTQSKLNTIRYDLTIVQGKRRLVLAFRTEKLTEMTVDGLD